MEVNDTEAFDLDHDADIGAARRRFVSLAHSAGLDEARSNDAALIATELASNVIKHARNGGILLGCTVEAGQRGVSIVAWDRGPGMNLAACMRDGMSTAGTAGAGLGAVSRLATRWDAYTRHGIGTVITAIVLPKGARAAPVELGGIAIPYPGLPVCGDAWTSHEHGHLVTVIVSDGLGHGDGARQASQAVLAAFRARPDDPLPAILDHAHRAAKATRGAAATVVRIDRTARTATIAGVGNVAAWVIADKSRQLVTQHGTLGQATPSLRQETYPFPPSATLVIATDGLKSRIPFDELAELLARSPLTIAAGLWRDHARGRDDATVVVLRETG